MTDVDALIAIRAIRQMQRLERFIKESNAIENIHRDPTQKEIAEYNRFLKLKKITLAQLQKFVKVIEPTATLRALKGENVVIKQTINGKSVVVGAPPKGGEKIPFQLQVLLLEMEKMGAYSTHVKYEHLHPFTDGNGRSGRMLWLWQTKNLLGGIPSLSFLQSFYYQTLSHAKAYSTP